MTIGEICNREVVYVSRDVAVNAACKLMRHYHVGSLVVVEENAQGEKVPVGMLTDRDITISVTALALDPATITAIRLRVAPLVLDLCNHRDLKRALQSKYSIYHAAAIGLVRRGEFADAVAALTAFQKRFSVSGYTDSVRFWLGNAQYGKRDYKDAIATFRTFINGNAEHPRAAEALSALPCAAGDIVIAEFPLRRRCAGAYSRCSTTPAARLAWSAGSISRRRRPSPSIRSTISPKRTKARASRGNGSSSGWTSTSRSMRISRSNVSPAFSLLERWLTGMPPLGDSLSRPV